MCGSRKYPYLPHGRDWKFQRGRGGGSRVQEIPEEGGGGCINNTFVFFQTDRFYNSDMFHFRLFAFCSWAAGAKINLVNSTEQIFSLWLGLISVAARVWSFSRKVAGKRSRCCGNKTSKSCKLHSLECLPHIFNCLRRIFSLSFTSVKNIVWTELLRQHWTTVTVVIWNRQKTVLWSR